MSAKTRIRAAGLFVVATSLVALWAIAHGCWWAPGVLNVSGCVVMILALSSKT